MNHFALFIKLMERNFPSKLLNILYSGSKCHLYASDGTATIPFSSIATIAGLRQIDDLLACYWQQTRMLHCPLLAIRHLSAMNDPSLLASTALDRNCFCALSAASGNRVFTPLSSTPRGHLSTHFERTVSSSTTLYNRHIDQQV